MLIKSSEATEFWKIGLENRLSEKEKNNKEEP